MAVGLAVGRVRDVLDRDVDLSSAAATQVHAPDPLVGFEPKIPSLGLFSSMGPSQLTWPEGTS